MRTQDCGVITQSSKIGYRSGPLSRATLDLGMAGRLREMASELQARAAEQEDKRGFQR
jgi:hypothetical protein